MDFKELLAKVEGVPNVTHSCHKCGAPVRCDIELGRTECWCFSVQAKGLEMNDTCMCKKCLTAIPT